MRQPPSRAGVSGGRVETFGMILRRPSVTLQAPAPTCTGIPNTARESAHGRRARAARPRCSGKQTATATRPISHDARPERGLRNPRPTSRNRRQKGDRGAFRPDGPHPSQEADKAEALPQQAVRGLVTRTETTTIPARVRQSLRMRCTTDQRIQNTCGISAPNMARPGLEPGTPRFSGHETASLGVAVRVSR